MRFRMALTALPLLAAACKEPPPQTRAADPIPPRPVAEVITPTGCVPEAARRGFDVTALKSQLMVAALSCRQDAQYNGFIERNRSHLVVHDRALMDWFRRTYGGQGVRRFDDFITSLANAQSQEGIRQGSSFCGNMTPFFAEISAVSTSDATVSLAASKQFGSPRGEACPAAAPSRPQRASR